ncbi:MAG: ornithine carbamoyltransferase [Armatimonadota bacterium]|nr:ornithine carbamoyltransferase [Armatimonadota bacterium]MDR7402342.1 ornithine carbamoyltransferase [Armatimonadota bacterium]MDR7404287.1 ornithine carbamoyltransferase [Armatimonadota bacterium]MDR7437327.1 ornithine carbamoyltransferase [Armatimonadota bacterium]MDR7472666.1 ornithine carbamoyltransferase [Armatimonadota bacterium]
MDLRGRDLVSMDDLSPEEVAWILDTAADLKRRRGSPDHPRPLAGKVLAMIFEKPSLRTRVTFEVAMLELGGHAVYLGPQDIQMGVRESVPDVARNLSRWVHGIMARTFSHRTVEVLAEHAAVPVINGLSDREHPCQTLGDLLTIRERFGRLDGLRVAWVGDGNNVCHSLLLGAAKVGLSVTVATPPAYAPDPAIVSRARQIATRTGARLEVGTDPQAAVRGADVIYTDVWVSMGQEDQRAGKLAAFAGYQVNAALVALAASHGVVMHCLPAHRGEEITDDVLDGPRSVVLDQAENRLHAQKALLALVL